MRMTANCNGSGYRSCGLIVEDKRQRRGGHSCRGLRLDRASTLHLPGRECNGTPVGGKQQMGGETEDVDDIR